MFKYASNDNVKKYLLVYSCKLIISKKPIVFLLIRLIFAISFISMGGEIYYSIK